MDKLNRDLWTSVDRDIIRKERGKEAGDMVPNPRMSEQDLAQIDFEQGEKIELFSHSEITQHSNLQYFSARMEFKNRLNALMTWNCKTYISTIYGLVTIKHVNLAAGHGSLEQQEDAIARFENFLVRNIRVPRKYHPPTNNAHNRRKSDNPDYINIRGNFDLVCRTPAEGENPHMLEFVLNDCRYKDALKKVKTFKKHARKSNLIIEFKLSHYTGQG